MYGLRLLRESAMSIDQRTLHHVTLHARDALVYRQIDRWMRFGSCTLRSSVASGIQGDIISMLTWLNTDVAYAPLCLPGNFGEEDGVDSVTSGLRSTFVILSFFPADPLVAPEAPDDPTHH